MTLGDRLRQAREEKGLSLSDLARKAGVSKAYLSQLERGQSDRPSPAILSSLAKVLESTPEKLQDRVRQDNDSILHSRTATDDLVISKDGLYALLYEVAVRNEQDPNAATAVQVQERTAEAIQALMELESLTGTWWMHSPKSEHEPEKVHCLEIEREGSNLSATMRRVVPTSDSNLRWIFEGRVLGSVIFGIFYTRTPEINPWSYGTVQLRRGHGKEPWEGFYERLKLGTLQNGDDPWYRVPVTLQRDFPGGLEASEPHPGSDD